jgi:adenylate cyclase
VNLASRLEGANKAYGGRNLVSDTTLAAAGDVIETREIDRIVVFGQSHAQAVYEIMGRKGSLTLAQTTLRTRYSEALAAYRARLWDQARGGFTSAMEAMPDDGPSRAMIRRIEVLKEKPPADDWDGSSRLDQK